MVIISGVPIFRIFMVIQLFSYLALKASMSLPREGLQNADYELQNADYELQNADYAR